jgi:hypothetical protein
MQVNTKFIPSTIPDNDITYIKYLIAVIESVDELSTLEITKNPNSLHFRLAPSVPMYNDMLLEEILKFHNILNIKLNLSKSIKSSATIVFEIELN